MRLLIDQNLSRRLVRLLAGEYPGTEHVQHVQLAGLSGADDLTVWSYAGQHDLVIVSKDSDFRHLALLRGAPPKVIWLRVGNAGTAAVAALLRSRVADVQDFARDPTLALLVLP